MQGEAQGLDHLSAGGFPSLLSVSSERRSGSATSPGAGRLHRDHGNRAAAPSCASCRVQLLPPDQVTLETAVRTVVDFTKGRRDLDRPLSAIAIEPYQQKWPC